MKESLNFKYKVASILRNKVKHYFDLKTKKYRLIALWLTGMLIEFISNKRKTVMTGRWEYYGFESTIKASKI